MNFNGRTKQIQIEGHKHIFHYTDGCENEGCLNRESQHKKDILSWCDECEKAFCTEHYSEYRNVEETAETLCEECLAVRKEWNKEASQSNKETKQ